MKSRTLSRRLVAVTVAALATAALPVSAAHAAGTAPQVTRATTDAFGRATQAVLADRTAALLDQDQPARATSGLAAGGVRLTSALSQAENTAVSSIDATRTRLAALGEAYSAADTKVHVDRARIRGTRAVVDVTETTKLTYAKVRGDEPGTTGFTAHHRATFTARPDGSWQLAALRSTDTGPREINAPVPAASSAVIRPTAIIDAPKSATTYPAPANPKKLTGGTYDYAAMAAYTEKYWKDYNTAYRSFNSAGGDCTNYLSQGLKAGGWGQVTSSDEDYGTWYYAAGGQSDSWVGVNEWSWFTQTAKRTTALANVYQMDVGDVLQVDFDKDGAKDHSMMTTYRSSSGVPYVTYHDADTYRRSLSSLIAAYPNAAYYAYRT